MTSLDFLLCCAGASTVLFGLASCVRALRGDPRSTDARPSHGSPPPPQPPIEGAEGLALRLQEFQKSRFATPIVQRVLSDGSPKRVAKVPTLSKKATDVVPFPTKLKKDEQP